MSSPTSDLVSLGQAVDLVEAFAGGLSALADFVESWDFGAWPPEVNSARLTFGPGSAPMIDTAGAYTGMAEALNAAAAASDGSTTAMSVSWRGVGSDSAQAAFRNHANWLRGQAAVAEEAAAHAAAVAGAYTAAYATMPPLPAILANRLTTATLIATNAHGGNTPAIMINEMIYLGMWIDASVTMYAYHGEVLATLSSLPPPLPPPTITTGAGSGPDPFSGPLGTGYSTGGSGGSGGGGGSSGGPNGGGNGPGDSGGGGNTTPTDPTQAVNPTDAGTGADQAVSDVNQAASSMTDALNPDGSTGDYLQQHGFYGTSPYSTTLAGLNGGAGSVVAFSMMRGGIGDMPGTATGFKMPANWRMSAARAFGASQAEPEPATAGRRPAPRRGVSAPREQMRRRRRKDEKNKSEKVFVPGELLDVPVLELPPVIGVIEADDERSEEHSGKDSATLGVLGLAHRESASEDLAVQTPAR
ncbi:PPE family protein [Nocardia vaccinii]|uniref:PPE family protein n=1 Tax=Nocardia vaccinii TaxID=1822 RepID=UPI00082F4BAA|nr:PPE domain-containing protein [Nocardia vaccinii]